MYTYQTKIKLHDTDAAGLLFFSHQFEMIHDAYEALLETIGFGFAALIREKDFFLPIVHAESDYKAPLHAGDNLVITVKVGHIGETSFSFEYVIRNRKKMIVGTAKTVHVTINKKTRKKIPLPKEIRNSIEKFSKKR